MRATYWASTNSARRPQTNARLPFYHFAEFIWENISRTPMLDWSCYRVVVPAVELSKAPRGLYAVVCVRLAEFGRRV
jgi:hypothetical protein